MHPVYAGALCAFGAAACAAWKAHGRDSLTWPFALVIPGGILPIVLVLTISSVKPILVDKYLIECLPFVILLIAVGIDHVPPSALSVGTLIVLLAFSVHALIGYYRHSDKDDWRSATHYVLTSVKPGDAVLFFPRFVVAPFQYYRAPYESTASQ